MEFFFHLFSSLWKKKSRKNMCAVFCYRLCHISIHSIEWTKRNKKTWNVETHDYFHVWRRCSSSDAHLKHSIKLWKFIYLFHIKILLSLFWCVCMCALIFAFLFHIQFNRSALMVPAGNFFDEKTEFHNNLVNKESQQYKFFVFFFFSEISIEIVSPTNWTLQSA